MGENGQNSEGIQLRPAAEFLKPCRLLCIFGGCQFQATENATKTQNTILKTYGKSSFFIFLHYINIWDQKMKKSVFYEAFYRSLQSSQVQGLQNKVDVWDHMSRVTS